MHYQVALLALDWAYRKCLAERPANAKNKIPREWDGWEKQLPEKFAELWAALRGVTGDWEALVSSEAAAGKAVLRPEFWYVSEEQKALEGAEREKRLKKERQKAAESGTGGTAAQMDVR